MALFYNQATLSYNNNVVSSNIVSGELVEVLSATKTALVDTYKTGDKITYIISIINSGSAAFTNLTITDNLGAYKADALDLVPLTYVKDSVRYYSNGVLQQPLTVADDEPLTITGISVPANGNAAVIYQAAVNQFAPPVVESVITNEATISGNNITQIVVNETISALSQPDLSISKSISPDSVTENGQITYTFIIQNSGNVPASQEDSIVVNDVFNPVLKSISVTLDGKPLSAETDYTYDETTGVFTTTAGRITLDAAEYMQETQTGAWLVTPAMTTLQVTGTV